MPFSVSRVVNLPGRRWSRNRHVRRGLDARDTGVRALFFSGQKSYSDPGLALGVTVLAHHAQRAVLEHATAQERLELVAYVLGQGAVFRRKARHEVWVMRLQQGVQQRALGNVACVARRGRAGATGAAVLLQVQHECHRRRRGNRPVATLHLAPGHRAVARGGVR